MPDVRCVVKVKIYLLVGDSPTGLTSRTCHAHLSVSDALCLVVRVEHPLLAGLHSMTGFHCCTLWPLLQTCTRLYWHSPIWNASGGKALAHMHLSNSKL